MKQYEIILADPPWRYAQKGLQGAAEHHYPTMALKNYVLCPSIVLPRRTVRFFFGVPFRSYRKPCA